MPPPSSGADRLRILLGEDEPTADAGPDPAPSGDQQALATWPTLLPAALHGLAGDVVLALEPNSEADAAGMLVDVLVGAGCAIGPSPHAKVGGSVHPPRLSAVKVGRTSRGRKGQGWADVREVLSQADPRWAAERIMSGLSSGEGLIASVADPDEDGNGGAPDKRLLVVEPEFSRVLAVASREGNTLSAVAREAWDSGRLRVMTRKAPLVATGAHVSIIGHITVEELRRRLTETETANGFANRFLFVAVKRSKLLPSGPSTDPATVEALARSLRDALAEARQITLVGRTPGAEERWAQLYAEMAEADEPGLVGAVTARAEAQCLRLSLIYALLDGARRIDTIHVDAAWAVWQYAEASARYIFGDSLGDEVADKLLDAARVAGSTGIDGAEQSALFGRHVSKGRLDAARELLVARGLASIVKEVTGGRPRVLLVAANKANQAQEGPWS